MSTLNTTAKKNDFFRANPVLRMKQNFEAYANAEGVATYGGIFAKTGIFMGMTVLGYILYFLLNKLVFSNLTPIITGANGAGLSMPQVILPIICLIATLILGFIAGRKPNRTPVMGSLYATMQGFLIASSVYMAANISGYGQSAIFAAAVALFITILIVMTMAFLYQKGVVRAGKRLKKILAVAFPAMIVFSVVTAILAFIPATRPAIIFIFDANPIFAIGLPLIGIVIATMTLISDFDAIEQTVEGHAPKMYEWTAAFGLTITVIWLYLKILRIVLKVLALAKKK